MGENNRFQHLFFCHPNFKKTLPTLYYNTTHNSNFIQIEALNHA